MAGERLMVSEEVLSPEIMLAVFDSLEHPVHLEQEQCIVLQIGGEHLASTPDGSVVIVGVNLQEDSSEASWIDIVTNTGVSGQGSLQASPWVCYTRFGHQGMLEGSECLEGLLR